MSRGWSVPVLWPVLRVVAPVHKSQSGSWERDTLMATTTKKDLIDRITIASKTRRSVARRVVQDFLDLIIDELERGNRIEFRNFGIFEVRVRAPRTAQNPKTLERVQVPARRSVKFKAGRDLRARAERTPAIPPPDSPELHVRVKAKRPAPSAV